MLRANLIFTKNDDVADDDIDSVAQACVTIQLCDLHASNKHLVSCSLLKQRNQQVEWVGSTDGCGH